MSGIEQPDNFDPFDEIIESETARQSAITSDDPILRTAARLTGAKHPELSHSDRAVMLQSILDSMPMVSLYTTKERQVKEKQTKTIHRLKRLTRIPLLIALNLGIFYSAEYNSILILPLIAMIIGYALVLIFARETGNVPN